MIAYRLLRNRTCNNDMKKTTREASVLYLLDLDRTTQQTCPTSSNKANFLTRDGRTSNCRGFTDVLMVATTVRVVNWVHGNTPSTRPVVTLGLELVVSPTGLKQGLVNPSTTSNDADSCTGTTRDGLFCTRRETDTGLVVFWRMSNDGGIGSGRPGKRTTVADLLLNVADDRSFGKLAHWENVSDVEGSFLATVDESAGVKALGSDEGLLPELVTIRVTEDHTSERSTTARVVDNFLDNTANVAVPFGEVKWTQPRGSFVQVGVRFEDSMRTPLCPDNPTHCLT